MNNLNVEFNQAHLDLLKQCQLDLKNHKDFNKDGLYDLMVDYFNGLVEDIVGILQNTDGAVEFIFKYHKNPKTSESKFNQQQSRLLADIYQIINLDLESIRSNTDLQQQIKDQGIPEINLSLDQDNDPSSIHHVGWQVVDIASRLYLDKIIDIIIGLPTARDYIYKNCQPAQEPGQSNF